MKTIHISTRTALLVLTTLALSATFSLADSYSSTNLQSDLPGVAAHVDPNLVNSWGMATPSANGPIWVSDNGTGVSTLYKPDGTARSLVVTVPSSARNKDGGESDRSGIQQHLVFQCDAQRKSGTGSIHLR
jgi:hypothetical protein